MGLDLNSLLTYKGMTLEIIVWSMFLGIITGAFVILYNKKVLGSFIRMLLHVGANTPDNARTLEETGFSKNIFVKFSLIKKGTYRKIIHASALSGTAETNKTRKTRTKLSELKYYIPDEMIARADSIYNDNGTSLLIVIITVALFLAIAILSFLVVPGLIQMLQNFVEFVSPIE